MANVVDEKPDTDQKEPGQDYSSGSSGGMDGIRRINKRRAKITARGKTETEIHGRIGGPADFEAQTNISADLADVPVQPEVRPESGPSQTSQPKNQPAQAEPRQNEQSVEAAKPQTRPEQEPADKENLAQPPAETPPNQAEQPATPKPDEPHALPSSGDAGAGQSDTPPSQPEEDKPGESKPENKDEKNPLNKAKNALNKGRQRYNAAKDKAKNITGAPKRLAKDAAGKAVKQGAKMAGRAAASAVGSFITATAPYWIPIVLIIIGIIAVVIITLIGVCQTTGFKQFALLTSLRSFCQAVGAEEVVVGDTGRQPGDTGFTPGAADSEARSRLAGANITVSSTGNCSFRTQRNCTSLEGMQEETIAEIIRFKQGCDAWAAARGPCQVVVTGGTEVGHAVGQCSHGTGYKFDIRFNSLVDGYIATFEDIDGNYFQLVKTRG